MELINPASLPGAEGIAPVRADFWRCFKCNRLCTGLEMSKALGVGGTGTACTCGAMKYSHVNLPWWGWLLPRVLKFAFLRVIGRV